MYRASTRRTASLLTALAVALPAGAQTEGPSDPVAGAVTNPNPLVRDLSAWQVERGQNWRLRADSDTGYAAFVYGGSAQPSYVPRNDAEYFEVAQSFVAEADALLGMDIATLRPSQVMLLPLALGGGSDKVAVEFQQAIEGVPVVGGTVNALLSMQGELLMLESRGLPRLAGFDVTPTRRADIAQRFAMQQFTEFTGVAPSEVTPPHLVIAQERFDRARRPQLAWETEVRQVNQFNQVHAHRFLISATGAPRVIERINLVHEFDVGGTVTTLATPGSLPDTGGNPEVSMPGAYMTVSSSAGTTTTDANGNFNFPGVNGPLAVTFRYDGLYNDVEHDTAAEYTLTQTLSGTGNSVVMNPSPNEAVTAQANVFTSINTMRDWVRQVNPTDGSMDFVNNARVMVEFEDFGAFVITNCNAVYSGNLTSYWWEDGGCVNTAYSTVVAHEQGHWLNDRYSSGNGSDGFGEGNADVFAMYLYDTPVVGDGFFGPGTDIRTGLNNRQYCGDGNGGCYGAVHADGEVHMGAMWKMRANLKATHGTAVGGMIADQLFLGWMNAYNQTTIDSIIEIQLLTLDDNDGNIDNGTPNYADIDAAYLAQGFPGFELSLIEFTNPITVADSLDEAGPYGVAVDLVALQSASIATAELFYDAGSGLVSVPMSNVTGDTWTGFIPGQPSPAQVTYFVRAEDLVGNVEFLPKGAPSTTFDFEVGTKELFYSDNFDGGGDNGWTHAEIATQDDWQRNVPNGKSGSDQGVAWVDPAVAVSGTRIWGNDLGPDGFNGAYQPNVENYLRSPQLDLSGTTSPLLRFQRWLTVEEAQFDQAQIRLNGQVVWQNPNSGNTIDTSWTAFELPIPQAAGDSSAQVEFRLITDGGLNLGGWNIDDFEILEFGPSPSDCLPSNYGQGLAGTGGLVPTIDSGGRQSQVGNSDYAVEIKDGLPLATATVGFGFAPLSLPVFGGELLIVPDVVASVPLDVFGQATVPVPIGSNPSLVGASFYMQAFIGDAGAVQGFAMTDGLQSTICN